MAHDVLSSFPPYYQAARTHDRTETEIDFPVGLTPQPSILGVVVHPPKMIYYYKYYISILEICDVGRVKREVEEGN